MKISVKQLKRVIAEAAANLSEEIVRTADGKQYHGDRNQIVKALLSMGADGPTRAAILAGQAPISAAAAATMVRDRVLKPERQNRAPRSLSSTLSGASRRRGMSVKSAEDKLRASMKRYAKNWRDFTRESPDMDPQDAALGFFYDEPNWQEWARVAGFSKPVVKDMVADWVYDAMVGQLG